jgi:hypothetical protein
LNLKLNLKTFSLDYLRIVLAIPVIIFAFLCIDLVTVDHEFMMTRSLVNPIYTQIGHDPSVRNFDEAFIKLSVIALSFCILACIVPVAGAIIYIPAFLISIAIGFAIRWTARLITYVIPKSGIVALGASLVIASIILPSPN